MARRTPTATQPPGAQQEELRWRYSWMLRSTLMADEQIRELVAAESERLAHLPIAEQVAAIERFLDRLGLLERAERLIQHLVSARATWAANEATRRSTTRRN